MCLALVDDAVQSQEMMDRLAIPDAMRDAIAHSWTSGAPSLYGRFDLAYDGNGPAKLLEFNADTPTSIYETAYFQWLWLENMIEAGKLPAGSDQFNRLHEALVERFAQILTPGSLLHFSSDADHVEDRQTVLYLEDLAGQAGLATEFVAIDKIGIDEGGEFADDKGNRIGALFKLYPWEDIMRSVYADQIAHSLTIFLEPTWQRHKGHPNLLPCAFADTMAGSEIAAQPHARKPFFSREGADIALFDGANTHHGPEEGYGAEGHIVQAYAPLAQADGNYAVIGSWIVGDECVAMSIREDTGPITRDLARFVPHCIV
jgi:glutathionylspermidine synthase